MKIHFLEGGKGSGHYQHRGRDAENKRGGSLPSSGDAGRKLLQNNFFKEMVGETLVRNWLEEEGMLVENANRDKRFAPVDISAVDKKNRVGYLFEVKTMSEDTKDKAWTSQVGGAAFKNSKVEVPKGKTRMEVLKERILTTKNKALQYAQKTLKIPFKPVTVGVMLHSDSTASIFRFPFFKLRIPWSENSKFFVKKIHLSNEFLNQIRLQVDAPIALPVMESQKDIFDEYYEYLCAKIQSIQERMKNE